MKYFLFIVALVHAGAHAAYTHSKADCMAALSDQVWANPKFNRWSKLEGHLDGAGRATLLLKIPRVEHAPDVPEQGSLRGFPELSLERDGATYAVVQGSREDLLRHHADLGARNGGRQLRYQVLERDGDQPTPRLAQELERRASFLTRFKKPFVKADAWLARFRAYAAVKNFLVSKTERARTGAARRLHRWRNPVVPVKSYVKEELYGCLNKDCITPWTATDAFQARFESFAEKHSVHTKLSDRDGLARMTYDLLTLIHPDQIDRNARLVEDAKLGDWNLHGMDRGLRGQYLERAWALIERATWGEDVEPTVHSHATMMQTGREYDRLLQAAWPVREATESEWANGGLDAELFEVRFAPLRARRPLVVMRDERDWRVVAVTEAYVRATAPEALVRELESVTKRPVGEEVRSALRAMITSGVAPQRLDPTILRDRQRLAALAETQEMVLVENSNTASRVVLIPATLPPTFEFDSAVYGVVPQVSLARLRDFVGQNLTNAIDDGSGHSYVIYDEGSRVFKVTFTVMRMNGRSAVVIDGLTTPNRDEDRGFWTAQKDRRAGLEIKHEFSGEPGFTYEGRGIASVLVTPLALARSSVEYGIDEATVRDVVTSARQVAIDPATDSAVVQTRAGAFKVQFSRVRTRWGGVHSVQPLE